MPNEAASIHVQRVNLGFKSALQAACLFKFVFSQYPATWPQSAYWDLVAFHVDPSTFVALLARKRR